MLTASHCRRALHLHPFDSRVLMSANASRTMTIVCPGRVVAMFFYLKKTTEGYRYKCVKFCAQDLPGTSIPESRASLMCQYTPRSKFYIPRPSLMRSEVPSLIG